MSVESCPKCGSGSFYHESKTGVNECLKCGHKWKRPTGKELMTGTVLDGYVEAQRVKPLTEFAPKQVEIRLEWGKSSRGIDALLQEVYVDGMLRARGSVEGMKASAIPEHIQALLSEHGLVDVKDVKVTGPREMQEAETKAEAVVRVEEIPTFTPAFLSKIEEAWRSKSVQFYWEWIMEPTAEGVTAEGVTVTLQGTKKPHEFFPKDIIERMKYDPVREHYYVPRTSPPGIVEIPIYMGKHLVTWDWTEPPQVKARAKSFWVQHGALRDEVGDVIGVKRIGYALEESLRASGIPSVQDVKVKIRYPSDRVIVELGYNDFEEVSGDYSLSYGK